MFSVALALALAALDPSSPCAPSNLQSSIQQAASAVVRKDLAAAKSAIAGSLDCPADSAPAYSAHILAADIAAQQGDWRAARAALPKVDILPQSSLSPKAGFIRLRADQGLADVAAFARDRAALIAENDARLEAGGRRLEVFRVTGAQVTSYQASVDQGDFHRVLEFIVAPDDRAAYPASILLTDDRSGVRISKDLAEAGAGAAAHVWFIDLYTCPQQRTLQDRAQEVGSQPTYQAVKARVIAALEDSKATIIEVPSTSQGCSTAKWILPGLGFNLDAYGVPPAVPAPSLRLLMAEVAASGDEALTDPVLTAMTASPLLVAQLNSLTRSGVLRTITFPTQPQGRFGAAHHDSSLILTPAFVQSQTSREGEGVAGRYDLVFVLGYLASKLQTTSSVDVAEAQFRAVTKAKATATPSGQPIILDVEVQADVKLHLLDEARARLQGWNDTIAAIGRADGGGASQADVVALLKGGRDVQIIRVAIALPEAERLQFTPGFYILPTDHNLDALSKVVGHSPLSDFN